MTKPRKIMLVFTVCALMAACASTYKSPGLPAGGASAIAVLEPKDFQIGAPFYISTIDGQPRGVGWFNRFELIPGRRAITVHPNSALYKGEGITRHFTAEAGMQYLLVVDNDWASRRWGFSIVETESGKRVDSSTP
jgi:hypothetical protein